MIVSCPRCGVGNRVPAERVADTSRCGRCKTPLSPFETPYAVGSASDFEELTSRSPLPVLVDFWAAWCGPCRTVAPELEKLAHKLEGRAVIAKVDTEALPEIAGRFGIRGIPTLVLFQAGRETKRTSGAMPAAAIAQAFGLD